jgi:hypothetical protein
MQSSEAARTTAEERLAPVRREMVGSIVDAERRVVRRLQRGSSVEASAAFHWVDRARKVP